MLVVDDLRLRAGASPTQLEVAEGETCVLLGRNHSGKTNLLRLIAGLPTAATGTVKIRSESGTYEANLQDSVAFVFQAFVNYPHWTVRQNLSSPLRAQRLSKRDIEERIGRVAQTLQIDDLLDRLPAELSGGQQQRVALGRALCKQARVLLLDEPFVNLDFRLRERLTRQLAQLLRDGKTSAVFSTSDSRDAFALGDKTALLADGELIQYGDSLALYRQPETLTAADLMSEPGVNTTTSSAGLLVVRPEHLTLTHTPDSHGFTIEVEAVETNGSHSFVQGTLVAALTESADDSATLKRTPAALSPAAGSPSWVAKLVGVPQISIGSQLRLFARRNNLIRFPQHRVPGSADNIVAGKVSARDFDG